MTYEKQIDLNGKILKLQIGKLAKQADSSILLSLNGTTVLTSVVVSKTTSPWSDVLPLYVDYRERTYAAGKIPGGFYKREGKPKDHEIIVSRLIDRSIRPIIKKDFNNEIQVTSLVISCDGENPPDVLSVLSSQIAIAISPVPIEQMISTVRVSKINNKFVVNPTFAELELSSGDMIISSCGDKIFMFDMWGKELKEEEIVDAIGVSKEYFAKLIDFQKMVYDDTNPTKVSIFYPEIPTDVINLLNTYEMSFSEVYNKKSKKEMVTTLSNLFERFKKELIVGQLDTIANSYALYLFNERFKRFLRRNIIGTKLRPDGRTPQQMRNISCEIGILPRAHGSALFTRGETQALVTVTLGTPQDMQIVDELEKEYKERFIFHYNFPGFATGEVKPERAPSRREIGHGMIMKKSIQALLPPEDVFPYTIRLVSDILESNGSSSMASVCGGSLALFDSGVTMKTSVAGVAIGLIKEENERLLLTDIIGFEDQCGDMDLKVAGTFNGVTSIQLDLKTLGISTDLLVDALSLGKSAREEVLRLMDSIIPTPRLNLPEDAPRISTITINPDKIGDLIGPGGKNIKQIIEQTSTQIDIQPSGKVVIYGDTMENVKKAEELVNQFAGDVEIGKVYKGKIKRIENYGLFVEIYPGKVGLLHISKIASYKIKDIYSMFKEGEEIFVKVIDVDDYNRPVLKKV